MKGDIFHDPLFLAGLKGGGHGGSASGPIVTFTGDGSPLRSLRIGIDPVQDLHGYDNPWPSGGGKNLLSTAGLTQGTPSDTAFSNTTKRTFTIGTFVINLTSNNYYQASRVTQVSVADNTISVTSSAPAYALSIPTVGVVAVGETYTFSASRANGSISVSFYQDDGTFISNTVSELTTPTFTVPSGTYYALFHFHPTASDTQATFTDIMLNSGPTALSYSPYSNLCPISGWSAANLWRTGKNLLNPDKRTQTSNNIRYYVADGFLLKSGQTYTLSISGSPANGLFFMRMSDNSNIAIKYSDTKLTYTPTEDVLVKFNIYYSPAPSGGLDDIKCQLELGSTATPYAPYSGTSYPITIPTPPGTVYGGYIQVGADGSAELVVDRAEVDLGTLEWTYDSSRQYFRTNSFADIITGKQYSAIICDQYATKAGVGQPNADCQIAQNSSGGLSTSIVNIKNTRYTDADTFTDELDGVKAVYELATPITYPLSDIEVSTQAGQNVMWADCGEVAVEWSGGKGFGKEAMLAWVMHR